MNVKGAVEAAAEWLRGEFGPDDDRFGRLDMISAFSEGAKWAERNARKARS